MGHGEETYLFTDNIIFSENLLHDIIYATPIIYELAAPRVIATFPGSNAQINYLGLHKITVTFNQSIQKGVQFYAIRLFSDGDIKSVISSITNNMLVIYSATPLDPPASKLGGVDWQVIIPSDAIVNMAGKQMTSAYRWTFSTIGVN